LQATSRFGGCAWAGRTEMKKVFWAVLSPILCALVGMSYHWFNEHYVCQWWVHCKHCVVGEAPGFDANDFTIIFFVLLCLLTTAPLFFVFTPRRWLLLLLALAINAFICALFMGRNIWL
jgi:hypothetical protein